MTKQPFFSLMAPHFPYIIFPGNVGNEDSLREVYQKLK